MRGGFLPSHTIPTTGVWIIDLLAASALAAFYVGLFIYMSVLLWRGRKK